jgi:hypothetical protein
MVLDLIGSCGNSLDTIKVCKTGCNQRITSHNPSLDARCIVFLTNACAG